MAKILVLLLLTVLLPVASMAGQKVKSLPKEPSKEEQRRQSENAALKIPKGAAFYIAPIDEQPDRFSFLLSDDNNRSVADSFTLGQIHIFGAVMVEAMKFAKSNENAGIVGSPTITRFVDKKEPSFIVDVEKAGIHSRFHITLSCLTGHVTVDAGAIKRDGKDYETIFSHLLSRIEVIKATSLKQ